MPQQRLSDSAPPLAQRVPKVDVLHGERRRDDYFWLRDKADPTVKAYLEAENAYADELMRPTQALQAELYREMLGRIQQTDETVPYPERGYFYYSRTEEGKQYSIYCRKAGSLDAPEEILLDLNALAEGETYMALETFAVRDDGRLLLYSTDNTGFREFTLRVKDLETGELLSERVEKTVTSAWAGDGLTFFYTLEDDAKRSYRLYRHRLGEAKDDLIYEETDERFNVYVSRSRSRAYLFLTAASHTASEVRFLPANDPTASWTLVAPRAADHEYEVDHHREHFYIRTNDRGRNFRLVRAPVGAPAPDHWQEVVPHRAEVMLEGVEVFARHFVLLEREDGLPQMAVHDLDAGTSHRVALPEPVYAVSHEKNREFETSTFRFNYQSLVTPASVFDYDLGTRARRLLKQTPVLGGYDPLRYQSERTHATARDGTRIPISIVYRKDVPRNGTAPLQLYGYGAYGLSVTASFSSNRLSLLDRGAICAIAHVRGGGELGKPWHDQGRMKAKPNTFSDFIAAAEHLIRASYTAADRLVIEGGSAGGLLVGAVLNQRPDLFKAAVLKVPFVDVVNTMLDESLPLTVGEFEEWGNPRVKAEFDVIKSYCPYTNLRAQAYPAILARTSFNDSQVMYWEPAKYVAKLRRIKTDSNPLLLKTNMGAGHGGSSGRYDYLREVAFDYAFILWQMGLRPYQEVAG